MAKSILMPALACCALLAQPARADDTGLATMHDMVTVGGRHCFATHTHSGWGQGGSKAAAEAAAHKSWYEYTAFEYGSDWASWAKSTAKKVSYTKEGYGWSATVESRPCK
jgi:hypothetical protein